MFGIKLLKKYIMTSSTMQDHNLLKNIFCAAVNAVQPKELIKNQVKVSNGHLLINQESFPLKSCYIAGFGKAVLGMATELKDILGSHLQRAILTIPKSFFENHPKFCGKFERFTIIEGAENNIPDAEAMRGAQEIRNMADNLKHDDDLLIVLISGGGSALLPLPIPPISLQEKQHLIKSLSEKGATIQELNSVRKQLSLLKGGGLAKIAYPAKVISLILSDVVGDPIDIIASGPTVISEENHSSNRKAKEILEKYDLYETDVPCSIKSILEIPQLDKSLLDDNKHVTNFIIGTNRIATEIAKKEAEKLGWQCVIVSNKVQGNVDVLANIYAQLSYNILLLDGKILEIHKLLKDIPFELEPNAIEQILYLRYNNKKILLIFAGEPTVLVTGTGKGGRNQQLSLAFSLQLNNIIKQASQASNSGNISILSAGTDGIDGPTDAAGAMGFSGLVGSCNCTRTDAENYLRNNDSYGFFSKISNGEYLIKTGHTGTNVMDLEFILIEPLNK